MTQQTRIPILRISTFLIIILTITACIRIPGSTGRNPVSGDRINVSDENMQTATAATPTPTITAEEVARIAEMEQAAKEALDAIQIERDAVLRKGMIETFLQTWPTSRHVAACIGAELVTLAELDGNEAATGRAALRESEHADDPRVLRIIAECLLDTQLRNAHALELAQNALAMEQAGKDPFRTRDETERARHERETRYRLTLIRALTANSQWNDALTACDAALAQVPDNDAGLICAIYRYQGDALAGAGRPDDAAAAYLQSVIRGDPRNRHTQPSLTALLALTGVETLQAGMDRFCEIAGYDGPVFDDVTAAVGLAEHAHGRVAWGDANGDGWPDILLDGSVLLLNEQGRAFRDVTAEAGLAPGGRGGLFADIDNDGDLDIFVLSHDASTPPHETDADDPASDSGQSGDRLYLNDGAGRFEEVPGGPLADDYPSEGAAWCDMDGDGLVDLYVANYEQNIAETGGERGIGSPDRVYRNLGGGHFAEVSSCFVPPGGTPLCGRGVSCADFNNDGHQDIFVSNYRLQRNFLWILGGAPGIGQGVKRMEEKTKRRIEEGDVFEGIGQRQRQGQGDNGGASLAGGVKRMEEETLGGEEEKTNGRIEERGVFEGNCWDMMFVDEALERGVAGTDTGGWWGHTIGSAWGDCNNDGYPDLFCANLAHPRYIEFSDISQLLINSGPPDFRFTDRTAGSGITFDETHSNPAWADVDNDGDLDLFITSIYDNERSYLYLNDGTGLKYTEAGFLSGTRVYNGWGCAFADFDRDGNLDLLVGSASGIRLFRNRGNSNYRLRVSVTGVIGGTDGTNRAGSAGGMDNAGGMTDSAAESDGEHRVTPVGARVTVTQGDRVQIREIQAGSGTTSQDEGMAHFGFGSDGSPVTVHVRLSNGATIMKSQRYLSEFTNAADDNARIQFERAKIN